MMGLGVGRHLMIVGVAEAIDVDAYVLTGAIAAPPCAAKTSRKRVIGGTDSASR